MTGAAPGRRRVAAQRVPPRSRVQKASTVESALLATPQRGGKRLHPWHGMKPSSVGGKAALRYHHPSRSYRPFAHLKHSHMSHRQAARRRRSRDADACCRVGQGSPAARRSGALIMASRCCSRSRAIHGGLGTRGDNPRRDGRLFADWAIRIRSASRRCDRFQASRDPDVCQSDDPSDAAASLVEERPRLRPDPAQP